MKIHPRELPWLDRLQRTLEALPSSETTFIDRMLGVVDTVKFNAGDYELS